MEHDEGYSFGMGVFETMLVREDRCILLERHLDRLRHGLDALGIDADFDPSVIDRAVSGGSLDGRVLKVEVSPRNTILTDRVNPYSPEDYDRGFSLRTSRIRRNETSPLTFIKSLGCCDSIMEKRRVKADGFDEVLFLNSRGEVCEGATTNIFFTDGGRISTPRSECGLLPGTVRGFLLDELDIDETIIMPDDIRSYTGCFITNSLMGVMPVSSLDGFPFTDRSVADSIRRFYEDEVAKRLRCPHRTGTAFHPSCLLGTCRWDRHAHRDARTFMFRVRRFQADSRRRPP